MRSIGGRLGLSLLAMLLVLVGASSVGGAHARLLSAVPAEGSSVSEISVVELRFSGPLRPDDRNSVWLVDKADQSIDLSSLRLSEDKFTLAADAPESLPEGDYFLRYRALSVDGDLQEGGYEFALVGGSDSTGSYVLLGLGVGAALVVGWLLRPRRSKQT